MGNWLKSACLFGCGVILCSSCSGVRAPSSPLPAVSSEATPALGASAESGDSACAYFYFLWGKSAEFESRQEEAREAYEKAIICDPNADYVISQLAQLLVEMNKKREAEVWLKLLLDRHPDHVEARLLLGSLYAEMGRVDEALSAYNFVVKQDPNNWQVFLFLGNLYARNKQFERAQKAFERVIEINPQSFAGYLYLGRLARETGNPERALSFYKTAVELNPSIALQLELASAYEQDRTYDQAIALYREILAEEETNDEARSRLVNVLLSQNRIDEALQELREIKSRYPDKVKAVLLMSRILIGKERADEAIAELSALLKEKPDVPQATFLLAMAYEQKGNREKTKQLLAKIPPSADVYEEAVLRLAGIWREEQDLAGAERLLRQASEGKSGAKVSFFLALASLYEEQQNFEAAEAILIAARHKYPMEAGVLFAQGILFEKKGDQDGALGKMQEVLELQPEHAYALNYLGYSWADKGIRLEEALQFVTKAVELKPDDGFIRDSLGWVYFKMGNYERAVMELEIAVAIVDSDPTISEHLGDAYLQARQLEKALREYERAFELQKEEEKKRVVSDKILEVKKRMQSLP